jgi:V-type H+-transporting ATPase subunit D
MLPEMHIREVDDSDSSMSQIGLDRGGQAIQRCRDKFKDLLMVLVKIASLQTSFVALDIVIKVTNRRVNALEYVVIPRFTETMRYIDTELDEMSKEDFFRYFHCYHPFFTTRLKKVLDNKKKMADQDERIKQATALEAKTKGNWQD